VSVKVRLVVVSALRGSRKIGARPELVGRSQAEPVAAGHAETLCKPRVVEV
jgi:hypothetical protein